MSSNRFSRMITGLTKVVFILGFALIAERVSAEQMTLDFGGRQVIVYVPDSAGGRPAPLMLLLHGGLGNAKDFKSKIPMFDEAERNGFVAAYLNGTAIGRKRSDRRTWNSGFCCGSDVVNAVDDISFISTVISGLEQLGYADSNRVVLVGHSNGAMMSLRFACARHSSIRGVLSLAGTLTVPSCSNASGVTVLQITGTNDTVVPIDGGGRGELVSDQPFIPLNRTVEMLQGAGANVTVQILTGASHKPSSIDSAARSQLGQSLPQIAAAFMMQF